METILLTCSLISHGSAAENMRLIYEIIIIVIITVIINSIIIIIIIILRFANCTRFLRDSIYIL